MIKKNNERNAGRKPISYMGKRHVINIGICPETWASDAFQAIPNKSALINSLIKRELNIL